jgi:hypothetical protein
LKIASGGGREAGGVRGVFVSLALILAQAGPRLHAEDVNYNGQIEGFTLETLEAVRSLSNLLLLAPRRALDPVSPSVDETIGR